MFPIAFVTADLWVNSVKGNSASKQVSINIAMFRSPFCSRIEGQKGQPTTHNLLRSGPASPGATVAVGVCGGQGDLGMPHHTDTARHLRVRRSSFYLHLRKHCMVMQTR